MEPEIHGLRDVVPWPMPDAPGLLLGRASSDSTDSLVWGVAGGAHGHVDLCCGHAGALLLLDVTGDARTEVVVAVEEPQDEGTRTRYLAYEYHDGSLRQLQRVAWMLEGLHGEAELRARAATLAGWPADPAAVSARELVLRMQSATPAQLRALLSPRGLRVCQSARGNLRPHFHRCHVLRGAALTDEALRRELPGDAGFADYETQDPPENSTFYAEPPQCTRRGNRETCSANIGGPAGTEWIFEGSGAARQLVEVGGWGTESS